MSDAPSRAVFLSYASQDAAAAKRICDALRAAGIEVWFDQSELRGGDAWDQKIRRQIKECALFLPIISSTTQERAEGYFRLEWRLADQRTHLMGRSKSFVVPVCVDETRDADADVPDSFVVVQWIRLPDGQVTAAFTDRVRNLLERTPAAPRPAETPVAPRRPDSAAPIPAAEPAPAVSSRAPAKRRSPVARVAFVLGPLALLAGGAVFLWSGRPSSSEARPAVPASGAVRSEGKSIAVLPFANLSEDKDNNAFFADGVQEDVLTNLGMLRDLRVVSRTSVAQYRNTTKPIRQIGEELRAAYVLEGSVRRAGKAVRVTGQLIRVATDELVWSKSYDRDVTDIFAVQTELAHDIARALQAALSPQEKASLARRPTESIEAYEAYLKAREWREKKFGSGRLIAAVALLEKAVALDPNFALAWAELGDSNARVAFEEWDRTPARLAAARAAIDTAVRLAPDDPGVIAKYGSYFLHSERDYARASEQYLRLIALRPNDPEVLRALGQIQIRQGRWADGIASLRRARELDPANMGEARNLVTNLLDGRRYAEAEALARELLASFPEEHDIHFWLAATTFCARGSTAEVEVFARKVYDPDARESVFYLRRVLARYRGDTQEAIRLDRESPYWPAGEARWAQEVAAAVTLANADDLPAARARAKSAIALIEAEQPQQLANSWLFAWKGIAQALLGEKNEAIANGRRALEILPESRDAVYGVENAVMLASIYAWVGEKDLALAEFARLVKVPHGTNVFTAARGSVSRNVQVSFKPLWDDPRFKAIVADPRNNEPLF